MKTFKQQVWNDQLDVSIQEEGQVSVDGEPVSTSREQALANIVLRLDALASAWKRKAEEAEAKAAAAAGDQKIVAKLLGGSLEHGWHGNPDNHTMDVTLYFGSRDPSPILEYEGHDPKLTREFLEFFVGKE